MKISLRRTGGFAGLIDDLGAADAPPGSDLAQLVQKLKGGRPAEHIGADLFRYEVTVEDGAPREVLLFQDNDPPENGDLRVLISLLANR